MGSIVKGVASLFGGRKRRRDQKTANRNYKRQLSAQNAMNMKNNWQGLDALNYDVTQGDAGTLGDAGRLGDPTTMDSIADLASPQGYDPTGYADKVQGYDAFTTNIGQLARGTDTGLTNTMGNLQVSTAGAEMAAREADQALAASQDLAAQAGTGAGGATALAAAAAKSKAGISADIDKQVKQNEMMRAQGESELQRAQLAQGNLASQFDLGQSQANVAAQNQAKQFSIDAANQAERFGAQAANQAAQFGASAANQFALQKFGAENARRQFNVGTQNQFAQNQWQTDNQFQLERYRQDANMSLSNAQMLTNRDMNIAQSQMQNQMLDRQAKDRMFQFEWDKMQDKTGRAMAKKNAADAARSQAKSDLIGGIAGIADAGVMAATGGFGDKAKDGFMSLFG